MAWGAVPSSLFRTPKCLPVLTAAGTWAGEDPGLAAQAVESACITRTSFQGSGGGRGVLLPEAVGVRRGGHAHTGPWMGLWGSTGPLSANPLLLRSAELSFVSDHQEAQVNRTLR